MMKIQQYDHDKHYEMVSSWWVSRDRPAPPSYYYPKVGFLVEDVAAMFLYQTDSKIALIENMISNRLAGKMLRDECLNLLARETTDEAKRLGFEVVYAFTKLPAVFNRAQRHGFDPAPGLHSCLMRRL